MKINTTKQVLLPILTNIAQATAQHSAKPITEAVNFSVSNNMLTITGTDLTVMLSKTLPVECVDGSFAVNAKKILSIVKSLPCDEITIEKSAVIKITSGKSKFELTTYGDDEFPEMPDTEFNLQFTTNNVDICNRIINAVQFTSADNLRPVLTAVYLESTLNGMNIVATDSVRLIKYNTDIMFENINIMLPKRAVEILKGLPTSSISINVSENMIKFEMEGYVFISRLINGKFPSYEAIIPQNNNIMAVCDKNMLTSSLNRMALVANPVTKLIKLVFSKDSLQISATDSNSSSGGTEFMPCEYSGEEFTIGFNYMKLDSLLKMVSGKNVRFEMSGSKKPVIVKDPEDACLLTLIMPSSAE